MNHKDEVLDFIHRRFQIDCNWLNGNCYYFSLILKDRFPKGSIFYNVASGHFVFFYGGNYYDWTGSVSTDEYMVTWDDFDEYDPMQKERIVRDCLM
ncbi:MAG: hypothetical protein NC124_20060 [Clostridium sp.]|nr:hypothetical protein [Clostridium sp.]